MLPDWQIVKEDSKSGLGIEIGKYHMFREKMWCNENLPYKAKVVHLVHYCCSIQIKSMDFLRPCSQATDKFLDSIFKLYCIQKHVKLYSVIKSYPICRVKVLILNIYFRLVYFIISWQQAVYIQFSRSLHFISRSLTLVQKGIVIDQITSWLSSVNT